MNKIIFCNLDLLVKGFTGWDENSSLKNRNEFLEYVKILCEDNNIVCFISKDQTKLNSAKKHFDDKGYNKFKYKLRNDAKDYIAQNKATQSHWL